jgi:hypothetical protein
MEQFIDLGGSVDSCGVWGIPPHETGLEKYSPSQVAGWLKDSHENRWHNVPSLFFIEQVITISSTATLSDLYLLEKGARFVIDCRGWGYDPLKEGKSIFWCARMHQKYSRNGLFIDFISTLATTVCPQFARGMRWEDDLVVGSSKLAAYLRTCQKKYQKREDQINLVESVTRRRIANWSRRSGGWHSILTKFGMKIVTRKGKDCRNVRSVHTSEGEVCYGTVKGVTFVNGKISRNLFGLKVIKVGNTCFAWEDSFNDHNEGKTVKEAISAFLSRTGIKSTTVSFAMVLEAKDFCIAGTKQWLLQNIPHLGFLLQPYHKWSDVPSDLMQIQFEFESRKWFKGRL